MTSVAAAHGASEARKSSELWRRLGTAALVLPPVVLVIWFSGWAAAALCSLCALLMAREFLALGPDGPVSAPFAVASVAALPWLPLLLGARAPAAALAVLAAASTASWAIHLVRQDVTRAARQTPHAVQAVVFCGLGPFALAALRAEPSGAVWMLATIAATFANDAAAYGGGRLLGRHRIAPRVSPGKSWEGAASGALGAAAASAAAALLWPQVVRPADAAVLAAICTFLGPLGDFAKSMLKRAGGVKDAGRLLPGHGGMLDRIDALVVNAVFFWVWVGFAR